jgi:hypothetical protein
MVMECENVLILLDDVIKFKLEKLTINYKYEGCQYNL